MNARSKLLQCKLWKFWDLYLGITTILVIILELYWLLVQVWYTTSNKVFDTLHIYILPCELLNNKTFWENLKIKWGKSLVPSLQSSNKTFIMAVRNDVNLDINVFSSCSIFLDYFNFLQIFCLYYTEAVVWRLKFRKIHWTIISSLDSLFNKVAGQLQVCLSMCDLLVNIRH